MLFISLHLNSNLKELLIRLSRSLGGFFSAFICIYNAPLQCFSAWPGRPKKSEQWKLYNSKRYIVLKLDVDDHVKVAFAIISGPTCNSCHFLMLKALLCSYNRYSFRFSWLSQFFLHSTFLLESQLLLHTIYMQKITIW